MDPKNEADNAEDPDDEGPCAFDEIGWLGWSGLVFSHTEEVHGYHTSTVETSIGSAIQGTRGGSRPKTQRKGETLVAELGRKFCAYSAQKIFLDQSD